MPGVKKIVLWDRIRCKLCYFLACKLTRFCVKFSTLLYKNYLLFRKWLKEAKNLCSLEDAEEFRLTELENEVNMLQKVFKNEEQEISFCHNDLQYGNIMMHEETKAITLIVSYLNCIYLSCTN